MAYIEHPTYLCPTFQDEHTNVIYGFPRQRDRVNLNYSSKIKQPQMLNLVPLTLGYLNNIHLATNHLNSLR